MRIFNSDKTQEITEYDNEKGYLIEDTLTVHVPYLAEVPEVKHKEIIHESKHGSTFRYVIDQAYQSEVLEHDEEERIYRYVPYTDAELAKKEIEKLKDYLSSTDWAVVKCMELGLSMVVAYPEEYQRRIDARERINELEERMELLSAE